MNHAFHPDAEAEYLEAIKMLFRERNGIADILAIAHDRRRPAYWLGRL